MHSFDDNFLLIIKLTKPAQRCTHLRTVVIEGNVEQSTNKQHRPGRGVVEIASEFYRHYLYNPHFFARVGVSRGMLIVVPVGQPRAHFSRRIYCWK